MPGNTQKRYSEAERRETCEKVTTLVRRGLTFSAACRRLHRNQTTVAEWFVKLGIPRPQAPLHQPGPPGSRATHRDYMQATDYLDRPKSGR